MKLGKKPARPGSVQFKFRSYFNVEALPTPPARFGHYGLIKNWGMFSNDRVGDCVIAGGAHETMMWGAEGGKPVNFSDTCVLSDYTSLTGYDPSNPNSDQGTDMQLAASYRRTTGLLDTEGNRHKIDSYVALTVGDVDELILASYLFGAVGVGINFPVTAEQQFRDEIPWDVVPGAKVDGGHYIPCLGRNGVGNILCVTWGRLHAMTPAFYKAMNDETVAYISLEPLNNRLLSPEGYNLDALRKDLASL